jgi:hypothetical protein
MELDNRDTGRTAGFQSWIRLYQPSSRVTLTHIWCIGILGDPYDSPASQ